MYIHDTITIVDYSRIEENERISFRSSWANIDPLDREQLEHRPGFLSQSTSRFGSKLSFSRRDTARDKAFLRAFGDR